jgi:hypothetical protein
MRVLWLVRKNLTTHRGGDTTQILQTANALRRRGVDVVVDSTVVAILVRTISSTCSIWIGCGERRACGGHGPRSSDRAEHDPLAQRRV